MTMNVHEIGKFSRNMDANFKIFRDKQMPWFITHQWLSFGFVIVSLIDCQILSLVSYFQYFFFISIRETQIQAYSEAFL